MNPLDWAVVISGTLAAFSLGLLIGQERGITLALRHPEKFRRR